MNKKLKTCDSCGLPKVIWKFVSVTRNRYCRLCWNSLELELSSKPQKPTVKRQPISRVSDKRSKEEKIYAGKRIVFLSEHPHCEINLPGICTRKTTDIHHLYSGSDRAKHFLDFDNVLSTCRACHDWVHSNSMISRELGFLK